ncbi:MAG: RsmD family RNA methyltransferase [Puniceicoccales bacterium]|jgi:16S rRNA (guanine966-N2)-methyltransferase|nr:RsmD family RNA methyltransferase [Puniceicoccales bacterium]
MRITGGLARGIVLKSVDEVVLRPATDYLRQAVFSSLGDKVMGANFLDIFAGIGGYGLEALSRGAYAGVFVENSHRIAEALRKNLEAVCKSSGIKDGSRIWVIDAFKINTEKRFDCIFIDPPYDLVRTHGGKILAHGVQFLRRSERSRLIFEMPVDVHLVPPDDLRELRRIEKGGKNSPAAVIYTVA